MNSNDWKEMVRGGWFIRYGTEELLELMEETVQNPADEIRWLNEVAWAIERIPGPKVESTWKHFHEGRVEWMRILTEEATKFPAWMVEDVLLDPDQGWAGASIW